MKIAPIEHSDKPFIIKAQTMTPSMKMDYEKKLQEAQKLEQEIQKDAATPDPSMPAKVVAAPAPTEPTAAVAPTPEDPNATDPRFIALTKKEKELLQTKREVAELKKSLETKYKPYEELEAVAKTDKLKALEKLGITYDDITNSLLDKQNLPPEKIAEMTAKEVVEKQIAELKAQQLEESKKAQQLAYNNAIKQLEFDIKNFAQSSNEFPIVKEMGLFDNVRELIEEKYHESGNVISIAEAVKEIEAKSEPELEEIFSKLIKIDKFKEKILKYIELPKNETESQAIPKSQTLTHRGTTSVMRPEKESYEQKRARIIEKYSAR